MTASAGAPLGARLLRTFCLSPHFRGKSRLERALERLLAQTARTTTTFPSGIRLDLDWSSATERGIYLRDAEPDLVKLLGATLRPGDVFIDCGANLGYLSLVASQQVGPRGHVFAFEPSPDTFDRLVGNFALNDARNLTALRLALGESRSLDPIFRTSPSNTGMDSLRATEGASQIGDVEVVPLDEIDLPAPAAIKIDTEGAELPILRGARRLLARARPVLIVELHRGTQARFGYTPEDVVRYILSLGAYDVEWPFLGRRHRVDPTQVLPHYARLGPMHGANYVFRPR